MNEALHTEYFRKLERALIYIEHHLFGSIQLIEVAGQACCSLFHFHRMFSAVMGESLAEYIRKRKMTEAARKLFSTKKGILELSLDMGYNSQEAFTRAFKDSYGTTPGRFRKAGRFYPMRNPKTLEQLLREFTVRSYGMEPKIIQKTKMSVIGKAYRANSADGENFKQIPLFWREFIDEQMGKQIPNRLCDGWGSLGICMNDEDKDGNFTYVIGDPVSSTEDVPEGFTAFEIPAATYAVFTSTGPMPEAIQATWKSIYSQWFPASEYEEIHNHPQYEWYDERCQNNPPEMDICIPVRKK